MPGLVIPHQSRQGARFRRGAPRRTYAPISPLGLQLWLDAFYIPGVSLGSDVGRWPDLSGHRNDAAQPTTASKPTLIAGGINGRPSVSFDGSDDVLELGQAFQFSNESFSIATVVEPSNVGDRFGRIICVDDDGSPGDCDGWRLNLDVATSEIDFLFSDSTGNGASVSVSYTIVDEVLFLAAVHDVEAGQLRLYKNNDDPATADIGTVTPDYSGIDTFIGALASGGDEIFSGLIGEVGVFNRAITAQEVARNFQYSQAKWRLA